MHAKARRRARTLDPPPQRDTIKHEISLQESNQPQTQLAEHVYDRSEHSPDTMIIKVENMERGSDQWSKPLKDCPHPPVKGNL